MVETLKTFTFTPQITWTKGASYVLLENAVKVMFQINQRELPLDHLDYYISDWRNIHPKIEAKAHEDWSLSECTTIKDNRTIVFYYRKDEGTIQIHFPQISEPEEELNLYKNLLYNTPVHLFKLDQNKVIDFINHTAPGTTQADFIGKKLVDTLPKDGTSKKVEKILQKVWEEKTTEEYQITYPTEYGNFVYNTIVHPILKNNQVIGATFVSLDITKEYDLQKKLTREQTVNDLITEKSLNGIYIFNLKTGKNEFINSQYTELLGYTLEDINNMSQESFLELFHFQEKPLILAHMQEIAALKPNEFSQIEYRFKCKDGSWKWLRSKDSGFSFSPDGKLERFLGSFVDITSLKNKTEDLKNQKEELNKILKQKENILEVINQFSISIKLDPLGRITDVNENFLNTFSLERKEELIGCHILSFNKKIDLENMFILYEKIKKNILRNQNFIGEIKIKNHGKPIYFTVNIMPNFTKGRLSSIHVIANDNTQKVTEEKKNLVHLIKQHDEEKEKLAFYMHEGLAQNLAGLNFQLQFLEELLKRNNSSAEDLDLQIANTRNISTATLNETIKMASELMPRDIVSLGLVYAIQQLFKSHKKDIKINTIKNNIDQIYTNKSTEISIYRFLKTVLIALSKAPFLNSSKSVSLEFKTHEKEQVIDFKITSDIDFEISELLSQESFRPELERFKVNNIAIQEIKDLLSSNHHIRLTFPIIKG